jgi:transcription-repair coupling factor (superfamily II helicase)
MNLQFLLPRLEKDPRFETLSGHLKDRAKTSLKVFSPLKPYLLSAIFQFWSGVLLVVTAEISQAEGLGRDMENFLPPDSVYSFPGPDVLPRERISPSKETVGRRLKILNQLASGLPIVVTTSLVSALQELPPRESEVFTPINLSVGQEVDLDGILEKLTLFDYEHVYMVEKKGQFSVRGGIVDVFPNTEAHPLRIDFFGDVVESIREFSLVTQVSTAMRESVQIFPTREILSKTDNLFDYLTGNSLIVMDEPVQLRAAMPHFSEANLPHSILEVTALGAEDSPFSGSIHPLFTQAGHLTDFDLMRGYLKGLINKGFATFLVVEGKGQAKRLSELLHEWGISPKTIPVIMGTLRQGFDFPALKLAIVTEQDIFGHRKEKRQERQSITRSFFDLMDLKRGDYVVHLHHGIGRYQGLKGEEVEGIRRDYLVIEYAMGDKLYVPTDQIGLVQKYVGGEGVRPTIYRLGGTRWQQVKRRVRVSTRRLAEELLKLYAERKSLPGYVFSADTPWQRELEESFPFEETPDQLTAINDVKKDMEKSIPADRLICGDVGYGKTEVAIRAAFKAVLDGKQVIVLVPTTILAQQHYMTFRERFAAFPIRVEVLSRLRSRREQEEVLKGLVNGTVDVVIGTHRLLQPDVKLKDLGLVIIDEEQRFGVRHKEHLKKLRLEVDVITLSATPIPRTLNMALLSVRDMSVIDTPPEDRYPVFTVVGEYDEKLVESAIRRELARDGQAFFVHNRVQTINRVAERLRALVPEARVAVAHGQMREEDLEKVMLDFVNKKYDVLVATTIIENGLDIPTVNTLIVDRADKLGLSQLYQIRGRVGRADLRSYAYFFYPAGIPLNPSAYERLKTIAEFTELGSGFRIAMRDLEIRGAGNILGAEQHGFINAVGFELYADLLRQAVERLRGKPPERKIDVRIELPVKAHIPKDYIEDEAIRVDTYRRVARIDKVEGSKEMVKELQDRFGKLPTEVQNLLEIASLKVLASQAGVTRILLEGRRVRLSPVELSNRTLALLSKGGDGLVYKASLKTLYVPVQGRPDEIVSLLAKIFYDIMGQSSKERIGAQSKAEL